MLRLRTAVVLVCLSMIACAEPDTETQTVQRSLNSNGFIDAGTMSANRRFFTMTSLGNGDFLLVGGGFPGGTASVDVYSAFSGELRPGPTLPSPAGRHSATFLQEARVLVTGGDPGTGPTPQTLLFDPRTNGWTPGPAMLAGRAQHTATLLPDGRLLVTGGFDDAGISVASAEVFDPIARTWTGVGPMTRPRQQHTATLLRDGRVLLVGGDSTSASATADADLFDPDSGTFTPTTPMTVERRRHTATLLFDGRVLIAGGRNSTSTALNNAQVYDPSDGGWSAVLPMPNTQFSATAALLPDGRVLIAGGSDGTGPVNTTAFFLADAGAFVSGPAMTEARSELSSVVLPAGDVLVCGGTSGTSSARTCERLSPQSDFLVNAPAPVSRTFQVQQLLHDGSVLLAGGQNGTTLIGSVQRLLPGATSWADAGLMPQPRARVRAVVLGDGRVLLASGLVGGVSVPLVELFDPLTGSWTSLPDLPDAGTVSLYNFSANQIGLDLGDRGAMHAFDWNTNTFIPTAQMPNARNGRFMCGLGDGRLFTGGGSLGGGTSSTQVHLYDATSQTWTAMPSLSTPRQDGHCELLPDGRLLIYGGRSNGALLATAELFSFDAGWSPTGSLNFGRYDAEGVMLPSGRVFVHGGVALDGGNVPETEIYDPGAGQFFIGPTSPVTQAGERLTLMPDGRVLMGRLGAWRFYDEGRGQQPSWTPVLVPPNATEPGAMVQLSATVSTGGLDRSSGNTQSESASPLVVIHERNIDRFRYVPVRAWSPTTVTVQLPADTTPGLHWLNLVVAGVRSDAVPIRVSKPAGGACVLSWECSSAVCDAGVCLPGDAGTADGGAVVLDAGIDGGADAGNDADTDAGDGERQRVHLDVGCGCSTAPALAAPLLLLLVARRRRPA